LLRDIKFGDVYKSKKDNSLWILISSRKDKNFSKLMYVTGNKNTFNEILIHTLRKKISRIKRIKNTKVVQDYELIMELQRL